MTEITIETRLQLRKGVLVRFEHNFNDGTVFLIDTVKDEIWLGNKESYALVEKLRRSDIQLSVGEIYSKFLAEYEETDYEKVVEGLNNILQDLISKGFVEVI